MINLKTKFSFSHVLAFFILIILINFDIYPINYVNNVQNQEQIDKISMINKNILENVEHKDIKQNFVDKGSFEHSSDIIFNITKNGNYLPGYNLLIIEKRKSSDLSIVGHYLLIVSTEGEIIVNRTLENTGSADSYPARFINSTTILFGDGPKGAILWNYETNQSVELGIFGTHEYEYNSKDNTVFTIDKYYKKYEGNTYRYDYVVEYNFDGEKIWERKTDDFILPQYWCIYNDMSAGSRDLVHANTIFYYPEEDSLLFNARNVNTFYKIDHATGNLVWGLGEYGNFTLYDENGIQKDSLFYHPHAVEQISDDTFILFDNDFHNETNPNNQHSRIVEIKINEDTMTANISWVWEGSTEYYSKYWGDANRLPNGNRLGAFGCIFDSNEEIGGRLVEVNETGEIVWEMNFPYTQYKYGFYRAERFCFNPIISPLDNKTSVLKEDIKITWDTFFNFNSRTNSSGYYEFYLNNSLIMADNHEYNKFWQVSSLSFFLENLSYSTYNLTLKLYDDDNHFSVDTCFLTILPFSIKRNGNLMIEKGQKNSDIKWSGLTASPLQYELYIDYLLIKQDIWLGNDISYDLNELDIGSHYFDFRLYNGTKSLYNDTFNVTIFQLESPFFIQTPQNQIIKWNDSLVLEWIISDNTPKSWSLFVNSSLIQKSNWIEQNYSIKWNVPKYNESTYNISLVAEDWAGLKAKSSIILEIIAPSSPLIIEKRVNNKLNWGVKTKCIWEVHGGQNWTLLINNKSYITNKFVSNYQISLPIDEWSAEYFVLGLNSFKLEVSNKKGIISSKSYLIEVTFEQSDPYANELIKTLSGYYNYGNNALGKPDGKFAQLYVDYSNGHITLDMGESEEIIDQEGNDFIVYSNLGDYYVWVNDNLSKPFVLLDEGTGNKEFDLNKSSFKKVRYIRISIKSTNETNIDAVEAYHYNSVGDIDKPIIEGPEDIWLNRKDNTTLRLKWKVYDQTPKNYSIYVNNHLEEFGYWTAKKNITFTRNYNETDIIEVKIIIFDMFGNSANDSVFIYQFNTKKFIGNIIAISAGGLAFILITMMIVKRKKLFAYRF